MRLLKHRKYWKKKPMLASANKKAIKQETASVGKFALIGITATLTHAGLASYLLEMHLLAAYFANLLGYAAAFLISFCGHYFWSFNHLRQNGQAYDSMIRFMIISLSGLLLNMFILSLLLNFTDLPDLLGILFSIAIVPALTFLGSRLWAFAHTQDNQVKQK